MFNFDLTTKGYIKEHNPNWPEISDHPQRTSIKKSKYRHKVFK